MRKTIIFISMALISWGAFAQHDHSQMTNNKKGQPFVTIEHSKSASAIIDNYMALKDALVNEDSKNAANFGKELLSNLSKFDASGLVNLRKNDVTKTIKEASQQAKNIADNSGDIAKQREQFEFLTMGIKDLIVISGSDRTLYQAYCPMYNNNNNNKGGAWLSTSKEINNPYFGSKMLKCGSVQQEISVK